MGIPSPVRGPSPVPGGEVGVEGVPSSAEATARMKFNVPVYYFEILEEEKEEEEEEGKEKEEEGKEKEEEGKEKE